MNKEVRGDDMSEAILTGLFTLLGVILGGFSSWVIAIYTNKRNREAKVLEKQNELSVNMLIILNEMIEKLPKTNEELISFKEYLRSDFYPKRNTKIEAEEMLYLTDDIRATFLTICIFAENDYEENCDYEVIGRKIITYRNIFVQMLQEDLKIFYKEEKVKKKNKRFEKLIQKQIKEIQEEYDYDEQ